MVEIILVITGLWEGVLHPKSLPTSTCLEAENEPEGRKKQHVWKEHNPARAGKWDGERTCLAKSS
jgi:hypothetical protein